MPEGHSVHRIARQFRQNFAVVPSRVTRRRAASPRARRSWTGEPRRRCRAVGKQMFMEFDDGVWLRVHLGMYGAWDFAGEITQ